MTMESKQIRVLLADDHAVVRAGIRQFLELAGDLQVVGEADDGLDACRLIEADPPDVAVLDMQMPRMSGLEVTRWIRARELRMGILVLTAYDDDPFVLAVLKAGANGYVLKTARPEAIVEAVREVNAGRAVIDPAITRRMLSSLGSSSAAVSVEKLTEREMEVLRGAGRGLTNKAIGLELGISDRTVQNHLARIYEKLQAASRTEAVMRAVSLGWLPPNLGEIEDSA